MASGALQLGVCACQCETGRFIVIEGPDIPAVAVVATCAVLAETAFMDIIRLMATVTVGLGIFELLREMALFAGHGDMQPHQRKVAQIVIEAHLATPRIRDMALVALTTQLAGMRVLRAMTTNTGRTQLLRGDIGGMTGVAVQFGMRSGQRKFSIARVIEAGRLPVGTVVALLALLAHAPGV